MLTEGAAPIKDTFKFILGNDGLLYPSYGRDHSLTLGAPSSIWGLDSTFCGFPNMDSNVTGEGCAARIMEEGWEMNY